MAAGRSALTKMANQKKTAKIHKQEIIEGLSLRDYVIPRSNKPNPAYCLQEMSDVLVCLSKHEYNEALCSKEINYFRKCKTLQEARRALGIGNKNRFDSRDVNAMLQKYPQPRSKSS